MPDGSYQCDKDGWDCGNGGVVDCVVVSDITEEGGVINRHFCRDVKDEDGKITHHGCDKKVLNATHLKHFLETQEKTDS